MVMGMEASPNSDRPPLDPEGAVSLAQHILIVTELLQD